MPFLEIGDCVHCYLDEGAKELPALLLANSLGTDLRIWDEVAARLVGHFRVIRYDKRGHGLTDAPTPQRSCERNDGTLVFK
jgi:pimeloyl-ACP methyl ester carboxylesterase